MRTTQSLNDSFFAKRVINTIRMGGEMDENKRNLFQRIEKYITTIENGISQTRTGNLVEQPVKSIVAYRKAIKIISLIPCDEEEKINDTRFNTILKKVKEEVNKALESNTISMNDLTTTYDFFKEARKLAIQSITNESMRRQESVPWQMRTSF